MSITSNNRLIVIAACLNFILAGLVIFLSMELMELKKARQDETANTAEVVNVVARELYKPIDFTVDFFGMKYQGNSDDLIDSNVLYFGAYEKDVLFFMRDVILAGGKTGSIFVDVGASNGQHSLFMSAYAGTVHAFEPYQPVLKKFNAMIELNNIDNIEIHPVGLGDEEEEIIFYEPPESNLGTGTFVQSYLEDKTEGSVLQIVPGDIALRDVDIARISVIKMDVEGYEKPALKGLRKTLEAARPFVVFEISIDPEIDTFFKSMDELLAVFPEDYGLVTFVKEMQNRISGNYRFVSFSPDFSVKDQFDVVAYPQEKVVHLQQE